MLTWLSGRCTQPTPCSCDLWHDHRSLGLTSASCLNPPATGVRSSPCLSGLFTFSFPFAVYLRLSFSVGELCPVYRLVRSGRWCSGSAACSGFLRCLYLILLPYFLACLGFSLPHPGFLALFSWPFCLGSSESLPTLGLMPLWGQLPRVAEARFRPSRLCFDLILDGF